MDSRAAENDPVYIDEKVGTLDGLLVIREDIDEARVAILSGFDRYRSSSTATLSARERLAAKRWADHLALNITLLEQIVAAAPRFFAASTFALFAELTTSTREQAFLRSGYWNFEKGTARVQFADRRNAA
jgi:hypothetical protein